MRPIPTPAVDSRDDSTLLAEFQNRRQGYLPQWNPPAKSAGAAMGPVFASILSAVLERLNQAPGKEKLAFLDLLGLRLVPAQPARAPIVFTLTQGASDTSAPEGTQVAAPPPPGSSQQIVFSTEEDAAVSAASLSEVISLWPGRDQFIDHSAAFAADQSFTLFQDLQLQPTDHILYLAHSQYLAFAGSANLKVVFDLAQPSSTALEIIWEYWDGQVWRGFLPNEASCLNPVSDGEDGTSGLARSGSVQLVVQGAQAVQTAVNGVNSYWIRARLGQPLLPDPNQILPEIDSIRLVTVIEQDFEALLACSFAAPSVTKIFVMSSGNSPTPGATIQVTNTSDSHFPFTATTDATGLVAIPVPFTVGGEYTLAVMDSTGATIYESSYTALAPFANLVLSDSASPEVSPLTLLTLATGGGTPLAKVQVTITDSSANLVTSGATDSNGNLTVPQSTQLDVGTTYTFTATWSGRQAKGCAIYTGTPVFEIDLTFSLQALRADKAYSDGKSLDVTKAFQPLGPMPQPGSVFYFKSAEAFSKPGATVQVFADAIWAGSPTSGATPFAHLVLWEYWNGFDWMPLLSSGPGTDFTSPQIIQFVVPQDMLSTKVNNDDGLWVRVRVAWGRFGYQQTLTLPSTSIPPSVTFPVIQAPVLSDFRISYNWQNGPFALEQVFTCNDFQYADQTANARWPGTPFAPYGLIGDVTPAFYLGFSGQLPVNNFGVYFDIAEQAGVTAGPAMAWEYWNGGEWTPAVVSEDDTVNLALPGIITFIPAADAQSLARFDKPLYWLRGRLKEDGPPDETAINSIDTNAVWASQWQMYSNSPLGTSTGVPSQIFRFNQVPILPGQEIEIQELSGPRANTEWRNLATQAAPGDPEIIDELEAMLAAEGPQTDILLGSIHLVRDRTKSVTAVWIQWQERQNFFAAGSSDRIYVLDHALGRMFFGDGDAGMIPSAGALIQATSFRSGGGLAGNVQAGVITQLLGSVTGVQGVTNPRAAEGGADGETPRQFQQRAPCSLRNRGRAIAPEDYEALAQQASAGVAVARAFPTLDPSGISRPGWVTVMIIPQSQDPRPAPSAGLRDDVLKYLLACAPADIAAAGAITVVGPVYLPVDVVTTLAPVDPATAGTVEQAALDALAGFLNPLTGGPGGLGWDVGRGLYASDISGVLGNVGGVDYVQDLGLYVNGVLQGEQVQVPTGQIVVAGQLEVSLVLPVGS